MRIVYRDQWGARPSTSRTPFLQKLGFSIHWEGPHLGLMSTLQAQATWKRIQADHMDGRNSDHRPWADIAYNWGVDPFGTIFEGRGWDARSAANGNADANARWVAICYLGGIGDNFTFAAENAMNNIMASGRQQHGVGSIVRPHSSFFSTQCPGDQIRNWIAANHPSSHPDVPMPGGAVHYDPPLVLEPIVSVFVPPEGGLLQLAASGAIYAFGGAQYRGAPNQHPEYWINRTAHHLESPNPVESAAGFDYVVVATSGERYAY